jgi:adenylyltransferase/sulfurtransferase
MKETHPMSDTDQQSVTDRHSRQRALPGWGDDAQKRLNGTYVVTVGAGAIGGALAMQLAAAGVLRLGIVDGAAIDEHDLGGQTAHFTPDCEAGKADAVAHKIGLLDPQVHCDPFPAYVDQQNAAAIVAGADLVADCTRDGATTLRLASACAQASTPLLVGTAAGWDGATLALDPGADLPSSQLPQASDEPSLFAPTAAAVAADLAQRALCLLSGAGDAGPGVLRRYDGRSGSWNNEPDDAPGSGDDPGADRADDRQRWTAPPERN